MALCHCERSEAIPTLLLLNFIRLLRRATSTGSDLPEIWKKNKRIILLFLELIQVFTRKSFYNFISQLKAFTWYGEASTGKLILVIGGNAGERVDTE
jgi:hypothetical protein